MLLGLRLRCGLFYRLCCQTTSSCSSSLRATKACNIRILPAQTTPQMRTIHSGGRWQTTRLSSCTRQGLLRPSMHTCEGFVSRSASSCTPRSFLPLSSCIHERLLCPSSGLRQVLVISTRARSSKAKKEQEHRAMTTLIYITSVGVVMLGLSYAGVPLYRLFCQATGFGGVPTKGHDPSKVADMMPIRERILTIQFNADTASSMQWNFRPQQSEIQLVPGETALAFYTARNPTDKAIIGISTYNVIPFEAGQYFNKIQCFCFEEQRLNAHEDVDMPVFFYIDPEFVEDPRLEDVNTIILSYTFFEAKEGMNLPLPGYVQAAQ